MGHFNRSSCNFEGSFEELDILNDTRMLLYHKNWTLRDYQPNKRNDDEDVSRPRITTYEQKEQLGFFFSKAKQLTVAVIARQVKSGVLRVKSIRD